jgi:hypothetical protein
MRTRILRGLAALALVLSVGGAFTASQASATEPTTSSTPVAAATASPATVAPAPAGREVLSTTERGLCIRSGTGEPRSLWFVAATHTCPAGWWQPTTLEQAFGPIARAVAGTPGPAGPAGPKGDPGDSAAKVVTKTVTLTASSPASQTVVLTGLPAKSSAVAELVVTTAGEAPTGVTVHAVAVAPAAGSTERSFTVTTSGLTGAQTFALVIKVLAVSAA